MTKRNKLIVGAVVVLGVYYLYDRNKKMKAVSELKAGADVTPAPEPAPAPAVTGGVKAPSIVKSSALVVEEQKQLNFAGGRGKSMTAQYFR